MDVLNPQTFVAKWRSAQLKERAAAQEHFLDLCHLIGHPTPAEDDPNGTRFAFEAGASKQGGGQGWADVWKRGCFAWEYKGKELQKRTLTNLYNQRPTWLDLAHKKLDTAVFAAYGWRFGGSVRHHGNRAQSRAKRAPSSEPATTSPG